MLPDKHNTKKKKNFFSQKCHEYSSRSINTLYTLFYSEEEHKNLMHACIMEVWKLNLIYTPHTLYTKNFTTYSNYIFYGATQFFESFSLLA